MSRKGENIRKRKDGRWEGRYKKGIKENGNIDYGSVYGKSYNEVKNKLVIAKAGSNVENAVYSCTKEKTFSEILSLWMETNRVRLKGGSAQKYEYLINTHIMPELGKLKLSQITSTKINSFLYKKMNCGRLDGKGGLSQSYVSSIMIVINSAINFAVAEQLCPPLQTPIYKPHSEKAEIKILTIKEQLLIEKHIRKIITPTHIGILISLYTGLRIGEICALSWEDIDITNQLIHVRHTVTRIKNDSDNYKTKTQLIIDEPKTKASKRDIPIPSAILPVIIEYRKYSHSNYIVSDRERFISPRTFEYRYHRVLEKCGVDSINFHALRHTFASRCIAVGVDIKSLSEILGHVNSSITLNTYVHSSIELKRSQLEKLNSNIGYCL